VQSWCQLEGDVFGNRASYSEYESKDLCFCLQLGDSRLSLPLPRSLKNGVEQLVVETKDAKASYGVISDVECAFNTCDKQVNITVAVLL
jgi:hypothetical protein